MPVTLTPDAAADPGSGSGSGSGSDRDRDLKPADRFDEAFLRKLEALTLLAKRKVWSGSARADRRSRRVGAGFELADYRTYAPGDDARAIDWNLCARLDRPFIRLREEEEDLALGIFVDGSASMGLGAPPKLELATRIGAALAYIGLAQLDRVRVCVTSAGVRESLPPLRGRASARRVLALLGRVAAAGATDLARALRDARASERAPPRRGLTVLISDFFDPAGCRAVLDRLREGRGDAIVVHVTARGDAPSPAHACDVPDGDLLLEDVETGERREVEMTPFLREASAARHAVWLRGVATACRERQVPYFQIRSHVPFEDAVLRVLRSGQVLS